MRLGGQEVLADSQQRRDGGRQREGSKAQRINQPSVTDEVFAVPVLSSPPHDLAAIVLCGGYLL